MLLRFVTAFNGSSVDWRWLPAAFRSRVRTRAIDGVPASCVVAIPYVEIATAVLSSFLPRALRLQLVYAGLTTFDRLAAVPALQLRPEIVVGFENACWCAFRRAKAAGALCVLDAASVHHTAQPAQGGEENAAFWRRVNARKDEEIALADRIVVLSLYAKETYVAAGIPPGKIAVIPPGVSLSPPVTRVEAKPTAGGIRFLFVGNVKFAKGVDLLLSAFARLGRKGKKLSIAGAVEEPGLLPAPLPEGVEVLGRLDRDALARAYANADILVLPSRSDGFGLVVAEAMSAGLPVIVSSATGAKDVVVHGENGWVVDTGSVTALQEAMHVASEHRDRLAELGLRAREAARSLTWARYGDRIRTFYAQMLNGAVSDPGNLSSQESERHA